SLEPVLPNTQVRPEQLIRVGRRRDGAVVHLGQKALAPLPQPARPLARVHEIRLPSDSGIIPALVGGRQAAEPVHVNVHVVIEEGNDVVLRLGDRAISGVTEALFGFTGVSQAPLKQSTEFFHDLRSSVGAVVIDDEDLMFRRQFGAHAREALERFSQLTSAVVRLDGDGDAQAMSSCSRESRVALDARCLAHPGAPTTEWDDSTQEPRPSLSSSHLPWSTEDEAVASDRGVSGGRAGRRSITASAEAKIACQHRPNPKAN